MSDKNEMNVFEAETHEVVEEAVVAESVDMEQGQGVDAIENCNCKHEPEAIKKCKDKRCAETLVTKLESLLMFAFVVVVIAISSVQVQKIVVEYGDKLINNIEYLEDRVDDLEDDVAMLEAKLDLYQAEEYNKPINITVNVDGENKEFVCDPETGCATQQNPSNMFPANFNTSPFLGVGFFEGNDGSANPIGLQVDVVFEYTPAALSGIKPGDIIIAIDGMKIDTYDDLNMAISQHVAKDQISIELATPSAAGVQIVTVNATLDYRGNYDLCPDCDE